MPLGGRGQGVHLLAPSEDGHVYVIEGATGCVNKIDLGERVLSMVLADDLDGDETLELVVGTASGEVICKSVSPTVSKYGGRRHSSPLTESVQGTHVKNSTSSLEGLDGSKVDLLDHQPTCLTPSEG